MLTEKDLLDYGLAPSTSRSYLRYWGKFERWCQDEGFKALPASSDTVVGFLKSLTAPSAGPALAAIVRVHALYGAVTPVDEKVRAYVHTREVGHKSKHREPIGTDDLKLLVAQTGKSRKGIRDRAMLLVGVFTGLRAGLLTNLRWDQVTFSDEGLVVKAGEYEATLPFMSDDLCPVKALKAWGHVSSSDTHPSRLEGCIFKSFRAQGRALSQRAICRREFSRAIQQLAEKAGLGKEVSSDSLRLGFLEAAGKNRVALVRIKPRPSANSKRPLQKALTDLVQARQQEDEALKSWDEASNQVVTLSRNLQNVSVQLQHARKTVGSVSVGDEVQAICRTLLTSNKTPETCLRLLALAYPDRVVILESAFASARKSESFRHSDKLAQLLDKLATLYFDAYATGNGDIEAHTLMGWAYAANDSYGGAKAKSKRTFSYNGHEVLMEKHLRIGTKESSAETIRVHFEWIQSEKKLVIGWCGEHL
jgi:integrase